MFELNVLDRIAKKRKLYLNNKITAYAYCQFVDVNCHLLYLIDTGRITSIKRGVYLDERT